MQYSIVASKKFKKDLKRFKRASKNISKLRQVIVLLENDQRLDARHKDHQLKGSLKGKRLCHIDPDWLLLYEKYEDTLVLLLLGTGTHREVLGIE